MFCHMRNMQNRICHIHRMKYRICRIHDCCTDMINVLDTTTVWLADNSLGIFPVWLHKILRLTHIFTTFTMDFCKHCFFHFQTNKKWEVGLIYDSQTCFFPTEFVQSTFMDGSSKYFVLNCTCSHIPGAKGASIFWTCTCIFSLWDWLVLVFFHC